MTEPVVARGGRPSSAAKLLHLLSPRRIVAFIEIACGIIGSYVILVRLVESGLSTLPLGTGLIFACVMLLYGLSVVAGFQLLKGNRAGYVLSLLVQALQIPVIASDYIIYKIYGLTTLALFIQIPKTGDLDIYFGYELNWLFVGFQIFVDNDINRLVVGMNAVPALFILIIWLGRQGLRRGWEAAASPVETAN
ncbi:hypothetical protein [Inquilinus sp. CA228]|uniref:hypothetical protein n=1 Tax=Inquilinus sp. CA228 TaxID=3455609 RepID=UPI003F8D3ED0